MEIKIPQNFAFSMLVQYLKIIHSPVLVEHFLLILSTSVNIGQDLPNTNYNIPIYVSSERNIETA